MTSASLMVATETIRLVSQPHIRRRRSMRAIVAFPFRPASRQAAMISTLSSLPARLRARGSWPGSRRTAVGKVVPEASFSGGNMSESPSEVVPQRGLWFEELRTGIVYKHSPGRTLGEADNTLFSTLTMNPQSLHLDAASSASTEFGERLVNSLLTMSVLVGLSVGHLTQ